MRACLAIVTMQIDHFHGRARLLLQVIALVHLLASHLDIDSQNALDPAVCMVAVAFVTGRLEYTLEHAKLLKTSWFACKTGRHRSLAELAVVATTARA